MCYPAPTNQVSMQKLAENRVRRPTLHHGGALIIASRLTGRPGRANFAAGPHSVPSIGSTCAAAPL